jgi:ABC-type branched-subunit amino acid transport system substrate-binding protein
VVLKAKNLNPDIIMMVSYVSDAALLTNTFAEHQVMPKAFIGTSGALLTLLILNSPATTVNTTSIFPLGNQTLTVHSLQM